MRVITGTSGYSYGEWKGTFYPPDLPASKMLPFYAQHFGAVEINATFYRMPDAATFAKWASEVPESFTFVLKAMRRMTMQTNVMPIEDAVREFFTTAAPLGSKLGPLFFQIPFKKDVGKLHAMLARLPAGTRAAVEFRHASWFADDVYDALREHDAALIASDTDDVGDPDSIFTPTASFGYLRLRRTEYSDAELAAWVKRIASTRWSEAYVFFKHEDEGTGPRFAKRFEALLAKPKTPRARRTR